MTTPAASVSVLDPLLARYERALAAALAVAPHGKPGDLGEADTAFARLRQAGERHGPEIAGRIEAIGLRANDLLDAVAAGAPLDTAYDAHARTLFHLRVALRGAMREAVR